MPYLGPYTFFDLSMSDFQPTTPEKMFFNISFNSNTSFIVGSVSRGFGLKSNLLRDFY